MAALTENALRFDPESETINFRLAGLNAEQVDRISFGVQPLHDPERAAIDRRAKETRDC